MQKYTWFYSLSQPLAEEKEAQLTQDFQTFLDRWKSHGNTVYGRITIAYHRFIIIQTDPTVERPSGCSIDSLKRSVGQILEQRGCEALDASHVFFRNEQGEIETLHFSQLATAVAEHRLKAETVVFDHSLGHSDDLTRWELPMAQTWMNRYLSKLPS